MTRCVYLSRTEPVGWQQIPRFPSMNYQMVFDELRNKEKENYSYAFPSDITSPEGEPLLSWRVNLCLKAEQEGIEVDSTADLGEGGLAPKPKLYPATQIIHLFGLQKMKQAKFIVILLTTIKQSLILAGYI